jgi:hypothetical protein
VTPRQRFVLVLLILVAVFAFIVIASAPAGALPLVGDCKDAPEPASPRGGLATFFQVNPPYAPKPGDPFVEGSEAKIVEQYGYAGLSWSTYDLGCGGAARDPWATFENGMANLGLQLVATPLVMATGTVAQAVIDQPDVWLRALDGPADAMARATAEHPWRTFLPLAIIVACAYLAVYAKNWRTADLTTHLGRMVVFLTIGTLLLAQPLRAVHLLDDGIGWGARSLQAATGGTDSHLGGVAVIHEEVLWRTWLAGEFGSPDTETAKKYGPDLFKSTAYSFDEWERVRRDPEAMERMANQKKDAFKEIAAKIEKEDRDAYLNLQGKEGTTRLGYSGLGVISAAAACLFQLVAFVMLAIALVTVRLFVLAAPLVIIPAMLPGHTGLLAKLWNRFTGSVMRAFVYLAAGGFVAMLTGAVLAAPDTAGWLKLTVVLAINGAAWAMLMHWYARRAVGLGKLLVKSGVAGGAAGLAGGLVAGRAVDQHRGADHHVGPPRWGRPPPPPPGGELATLPPPPRFGTGFEFGAEHPGYDLGEARLRAEGLPSGEKGLRPQPGPVRPPAPGLPSGTPELSSGARAVTSGSAKLAVIDAVPVVDHDGGEVYVATARSSTSHRSVSA